MKISKLNLMLSSGVLLSTMALPAMARSAALIDIGVGTYYSYSSDFNLTEVDANDSVETGSAIEANESVTAGSETFNTRPVRVGERLQAGERVRVDRSDFNANASLSARANEALEANEEIRTKDSLEAHKRLEDFSTEKLRADENIEGLSFDFETVSLSYRTRNEIFGLISLSSITRATVRADGEVEVECPWYGCSKRDEARFEEEVKSDVAPLLPATGANWSVDAQINIAELLHTRFKAERD